MRLVDSFLLKNMSDEKYLKLKYFFKIGKMLNLKKPLTFNEKMQWLKLNNRKDIYTTMVDKYEVKQYISKIIGEDYLIPTLGIYDSFEKINFDSLPNQFVIKCTHDSGGTIICKNKEDFDIEFAKNKIEKCLNFNYYIRHREWPYKNVKPRIIVEKYMEDKKNPNMIDYKFFCFNGKAEYILVCSDRESELKETFYDLNWNIAPFKRSNHDRDYSISMPLNLNKMIEIANILSKTSCFLRVDFYEIDGKIYFGELTFFPASGFAKFDPEIWDIKLGNLIDLSYRGE